MDILNTYYIFKIYILYFIEIKQIKKIFNNTKKNNKLKTM